MDSTSITDIYQKYQQCSSVSTDTRKLEKDCLFVALKGPNFDGNKFAEQALEDGAKWALVSDEELAENDNCIYVDDTLLALQQLANHHRHHLSIPVLGITGSNGKTTTKELIREVLKQKYKVHATEGNLNNHIGVPLTILNAPDEMEILVVEMGANQIDDIKELCQIAEPTHGLITNIGKAHLAGFGGADGVLRAKSQLYNWLLEHEGIPFTNSQDNKLANMSKRFVQAITYPAKDDYYHCELMEADPFVVLKAEDGEVVKSQLLGVYNFPNVAAALCIGKYFKVESKKANQAISDYVPGNNRSQVLHKGDNMIILDAYNANPTSMKAALESFATLRQPNKVVILGDMNELGEDSVEEHHEMGRLIAQLKFDKVILCGQQMMAALDNNPHAAHFESIDTLLAYIKSKDFSESAILIKGSRSMKLEKVAEVL
jgi:UDP-N-acetylmuramoyl-tripeptide--D-alanyl-D-alanine ligase